MLFCACPGNGKVCVVTCVQFDLLPSTACSIVYPPPPTRPSPPLPSAPSSSLSYLVSVSSQCERVQVFKRLHRGIAEEQEFTQEMTDELLAPPIPTAAELS